MNEQIPVLVVENSVVLALLEVTALDVVVFLGLEVDQLEVHDHHADCTHQTKERKHLDNNPIYLKTGINDLVEHEEHLPPSEAKRDQHQQHELERNQQDAHARQIRECRHCFGLLKN